jgi:hypothetical protein
MCTPIVFHVQMGFSFTALGESRVLRGAASFSRQPPRVRALDGCDLRAACGLRTEHTHIVCNYPFRGCFLCSARYKNSQKKGWELGALKGIEPAVINC